ERAFKEALSAKVVLGSKSSLGHAQCQQRPRTDAADQVLELGQTLTCPRALACPRVGVGVRRRLRCPIQGFGEQKAAQLLLGVAELAFESAELRDHLPSLLELGDAALPVGEAVLQ